MVGPGLISAAADNDAQGITTYAVVGSRYGYALLWLIPIAGLALFVTQEVGARIGVMTGKGLSSLIRERFGVRLAAFAMLLLLVANLGTTAAEFAGIAAAGGIFGIPRAIAVPAAAAVVMVLILRGGFRRIERVFIVMSLLLLAYVISGLLAQPDWSEAVRGLTTPSLHLDGPVLLAAVALVGTTVTPWGQFFIQAYVVDKALAPEDLGYERADVGVGVSGTIIVAFFVIVATAATIHVAGGTITDAADAARALEPLAGRFAAELFALGLLNAALLGAAVLPLSTSYAVCEALGFEFGLDRGIREAPVFYGLFAGVLAIGAVIVLLPGVSLVPVLLISAAVNGVLLAPILIFLAFLANDRELLGARANGRLGNVLLIGTIVLLLLLTAVLVITALG